MHHFRDGSPVELLTLGTVKKQVFTLLFFVNQALIQVHRTEQAKAEPPAIRYLILLLLQLLTVDASQFPQIMDIARLCLGQALRHTPAIEFLQVASACLQSSDLSVSNLKPPMCL